MNRAVIAAAACVVGLAGGSAASRQEAMPPARTLPMHDESVQFSELEIRRILSHALPPVPPLPPVVLPPLPPELVPPAPDAPPVSSVAIDRPAQPTASVRSATKPSLTIQ